MARMSGRFLDGDRLDILLGVRRDFVVVIFGEGKIVFRKRQVRFGLLLRCRRFEVGN